jgi:hypothetical protein
MAAFEVTTEVVFDKWDFEKGAALLDFLIFVKFRASSPVRGRLRLRFFLDEFQRAATTGWG